MRTIVTYKISVMWDTDTSVQTSSFECSDLNTAKQYVRMMQHSHDGAFVRVYKATTTTEPINLGI